MRLALALGRRGLGRVWPNPAVGCVIVAGGGDPGRIVGRGCNQPIGRHDDVDAGRLAAALWRLPDTDRAGPLMALARPRQA